MNKKKLIVNIAVACFFLMGAILVGIGLYWLSPSGEQSKMCYDVNYPNKPAKSDCPSL